MYKLNLAVDVYASIYLYMLKALFCTVFEAIMTNAIGTTFLE